MKAPRLESPTEKFMLAFPQSVFSSYSVYPRGIWGHNSLNNRIVCKRGLSLVQTPVNSVNPNKCVPSSPVNPNRCVPKAPPTHLRITNRCVPADHVTLQMPREIELVYFFVYTDGSGNALNDYPPTQEQNNRTSP